MKFLCVCQGGNVRSVVLAYVLKYYGSGHNAVAIGIDHLPGNSETLLHFAQWADHILTVVPIVTDTVKGMLATTPELEKVIEIPIGEDYWGIKKGPYNEQLIEKAYNLLKEAGFVE